MMPWNSSPWGLLLSGALSLVAILLPLLCMPASDAYYEQKEATAHKLYQARLQQQHHQGFRFGVMSFNIRVDQEERNMHNHFTKRVTRLRDTIFKWKPALIGMQEPFGPQVARLLSEFPDPKDADGVDYGVLGYNNRPGIDPNDWLHPAKRYDLTVGILYRKDLLKLKDFGYYWLGEGNIKTSTTEIEFHDGHRARLRKANVGLFEVMEPYNNQDAPTLILLVNTHLSVHSESARRDQADSLMNDAIMVWKEKYPTAHLFVTGDFNSAPGQAPHRTLVGPQRWQQQQQQQQQQGHGSKQSSVKLSDAWQSCKTPSSFMTIGNPSLDSCFKYGPVNSFHGWLGTWSHIYLIQLALPFLHTFHAMQLDVPFHVPPLRVRLMMRAIRRIFMVPPEYSVSESMPDIINGRYHVDWILHEMERSKAKVLVIGDVRSTNLSSDHYPLVGLFELAPVMGADQSLLHTSSASP